MAQAAKFTNEQIKEIINAYSNTQVRLSDLSAEYHTSPKRLRAILQENNVHIRNVWESRHVFRMQKTIQMSNEYKIYGEVTHILVNSAKYGVFNVLIDTEDLENVLHFYTWFVRPNANNKTWYAFGKKPKEKGRSDNFLIHRVIMDAPKDMLVDHINHDGLDNRKCNLRLCSQVENQLNRDGAASHSTSGIRGVHWSSRKQRWIANVVINGQKMHVGTFTNKDDAAIAVSRYRRIHVPYSQDDKASY